MFAGMIGLNRSRSMEIPMGAPTVPYAGSFPKITTRPRSKRNKPRKHRSSGRSYRPNGAQECARRMRQIAAGTLRISNGLVCPGVRYLGHGRIERVAIA